MALRSPRAALALGASALLASGCAYAVAPVTGFVYSDVDGPLTATSNPDGSKTGIAQCESILGIVASGDCSIAAAARNGGISRIRHVDFKTKSILGVYAEFTTTVYGE